MRIDLLGFSSTNYPFRRNNRSHFSLKIKKKSFDSYNVAFDVQQYYKLDSPSSLAQCIWCRPRFCVFTVRLHVMQRMILLSQFYLSVYPSDACIVTKLNDGVRIFWYHTKRNSNHYSFLTPIMVGGMPLPSEICAQSDPPPSKNADFDRFAFMTSQP